MLRHLRRPLGNNAGLILSRMQTEPRIKAIGRMFSVQDSLPRLPLPQIDQTLQKYLRTVQPLVNADDYRHTEKLVEAFKKSPGPELQALLEKRATEKVNWLSDWWKDVAYLSIRTPVVIASNPAVIFPRQDYNDKKGQLRFAAKVIAGVIDYKITIDEQTLPVELLGGKPLCMIQYYTILGGCRIPGVKRDSHVLYPSTDPNPPRHITVMHKNQLFSVDVYGNDNRPLNVEQIYEQLKKIVEMSPNAAPSIGVLTMGDRTSWAKTYKHLVKDKANKTAMESLQRSIFVMCLDSTGPQPTDEDHANSLAITQMLHGGGSAYNSGNRWFDKTLQFVVGENGVCGLNYEHTTAEGPPIAAIMDHVLTFCEKNEEMGLKAGGMTDVRKLPLNYSQELLKDIEEAKVHADSMANDVDMRGLTYEGYGKNFPKSQRLSPDGYIQIAMQLAYFKLYGKPCATYETASLRRFKLGRTDTIRSCSVDSFNFTKAMLDSSISREVKVDLFKKAVMAHRKYTDEAINGSGIDRHLLGWKLAAVEAGMNIPDLHMDGSFATSLYFKISTSQVAAKHDAVMAFGAVVPDGYGICYNPQNTKINFSVSSYFNSPETDSKRYETALKESLDDLQTLLGPPQAKL
ncbi:carnitine O-acetyltransferase-like isoform X1 [Haliotis rubra]|uniref:carnitine O-acetyltransferase-like isoform X1 n=2 Tax=Haliotis rubra TaxID=36100 RepID=UPI001EE5001C|nr:carnitine O-acetyltransferase-like isoform X1 [Haliotis rubra]